MPTNMTVLKSREYSYISSDLQRWRCQIHWFNLHLLKANLSTWIK